MDKVDDEVIKGDTCFAAHARCHVECNRKSCRNWLPDAKHCNCSLVAAKSGPMTLQEVGDVYELTRMRICQIEKNVCRKLFLPVVD